MASQLPTNDKNDRNDEAPARSHRLEDDLHDALMKSGPPRPLKLVPPAGEEGPGLPEPPYPRRPEARERVMPRAEYDRINRNRGLFAWGKPFFQSRFVHRDELRPIIAYLFTDYKCNLSCHYCWSYDNRVSGMSEATARRSIDWLHSIGCRVLALMGGEPLLRPQFVHKVIDYAAARDFFVYLPTNGRLFKPEVVDRLGDAGVATINLAVDSVEDRKELPKALRPIQDNFEYLVKMQRRYGYTMFFNINITRINLDDVKALTEIAREHGIATDYHINESPLTEQQHFDRLDGNSTYLTEEDWPRVEELIRWILDKHDSGYKIVNPKPHFPLMTRLMRGPIEPWPCRAGQNSLIIRTDGTLAPCFPTYSATYDWGRVGEPRFDRAQLTEMKKECSRHCLSTCNYILSYCYDTSRVIGWFLKQARRGFRGVSGSF
jgi:MoaA/NifB/PqqE/SkfB family radical SAM enzyme